MMRVGIGVFILALTISLIAGCGPSQNASDQAEADLTEQPPTDDPPVDAAVTEQPPTDAFPVGAESTEQLPTDDPPDQATVESSGGVQAGSDAQWPDYIPAAIPVLPGQIESILAASESHVRLFYGDISEKQIEEYLALLQDEGFELEFRIYVQEGFPDNSEERRSRGEYDAVDITKGEYHMSLSHGEGRATYDVYTSGFREVAKAALAVDWPKDLEGLAPPPERCELVTVNPDGRGGYHIACKRADENVDQDYLALLESQGFLIQETFENSQGEVTLQRLRRGDVVVELSSVFGPYFTLQVSLQPLPRWPDVFGDSVPRPAGCELTAIIPSNQDTIHITCKPEDKSILQDYVSVLEQLGFTEQSKFLNESGDILIITLSDGSTMVDLSSDAPDTMSIRVSQKSP